MASTIDNTKPETNALVLSSTIRALATAAKNDIEAIQTNYATKDYVDNSIVGLWDDRGNYDASLGVYPSTGGSGTSGAILKGDIWTASVAGIIGGTAIAIGGTIRALVDSPAQTNSNWSILTGTDLVVNTAFEFVAIDKSVLGTSAVQVQQFLLTAGTYTKFKGYLGTDNPAQTATLELRKLDGTVLDTIQKLGNIDYVSQAISLTIATDTKVIVVLYASSPTTTAFATSFGVK